MNKCTLLCVTLLAAILATPTPGLTPPSEEEADRMLSMSRWQEASEGVSFRPPLECKFLTRATDKALAVVAGKGNYFMSLYLHRTRDDENLTLSQVAKLSIEQIGTANPTARILDQPRIRVKTGEGDDDVKPGKIIYYRVMKERKNKQRDDWVVGEAFVMVDPKTWIEMQLEVPYRNFENARPIFEAAVFSINVEDAEAIQARRKKQLEAGKAVIQLIDHKRRLDAMVPEQLWRITDNGKDIGYIIVQMARSKQMGQDGIQVDVKARLSISRGLVDTLSQFFLTADGKEEYFQIKTTIRDDKPGPNGLLPKPVTWVDTGTRQDENVTLVREGPDGKRDFSWKVPLEHYLSQVEIYLLHGLLPHEKRGDYSFYAYNPAKGAMALRTERVIPDVNGTYKIISRRTQDQQEQVSTYDRRERLITRTLSSKQVILPTTAQQLKAVWKLK